MIAYNIFTTSFEKINFLLFIYNESDRDLSFKSPKSFASSYNLNKIYEDFYLIFSDQKNFSRYIADTNSQSANNFKTQYWLSLKQTSFVFSLNEKQPASYPLKFLDGTSPTVNHIYSINGTVIPNFNFLDIYDELYIYRNFQTIYDVYSYYISEIKKGNTIYQKNFQNFFLIPIIDFSILSDNQIFNSKNKICFSLFRKNFYEFAGSYNSGSIYITIKTKPENPLKIYKNDTIEIFGEKYIVQSVALYSDTYATIYLDKPLNTPVKEGDIFFIDNSFSDIFLDTSSEYNFPIKYLNLGPYSASSPENFFINIFSGGDSQIQRFLNTNTLYTSIYKQNNGYNNTINNPDAIDLDGKNKYFTISQSDFGFNILKTKIVSFKNSNDEDIIKISSEIIGTIDYEKFKELYDSTVVLTLQSDLINEISSDVIILYEPILNFSMKLKVQEISLDNNSTKIKCVLSNFDSNIDGTNIFFPLSVYLIMPKQYVAQIQLNTNDKNIIKDLYLRQTNDISLLSIL